MAERRMFAKTIVLSDAFLDMPITARCLYFTLGMVADDDGFVNAPKSVMRQISSSSDDLNILIAKKFILPFESGVIVIKHWRINNYLRNDRYIETKYKDEKSELEVDENGAYKPNVDCGIPSIGIPSIGKDSIGKDSISNTLCRDHSDEIEQVIAYLNDKSHSKFSAKTAETKKLLSGRFSDGYTAEDMEHVIDLKCDQWLTDVKMRQYIRPSTLFLPSKFESYLNEYNRTHTDEQQECKSEVKNNTNSPHIAIPEDCR